MPPSPPPTCHSNARRSRVGAIMLESPARAWGSSDQVEASFRDARAVALGAGAADDERMPVHVEVVSPADVADDALDRRVLELDHLAAPLALQVLVLRIAVLVL